MSVLRIVSPITPDSGPPAIAETHKSDRAGWLRAAVLGADDGIVSTASLMIGVAASSGSVAAILLAGLAGLVAGSMSMAAGEYVSVSSQRDAELADTALEASALARSPAGELEELATIYESRGLEPPLARTVAERLTAHDALQAHLRDELGLREATAARPLQAAIVSAVSFGIGGGLPVLVAFLAPGSLRTAAIALSALIFLGVLGAVGAAVGGAPMRRGMVRVLLGGAAAMAVTAIIGRLAGVAGL
jgi:VIT1/CCC1 family predicted Fe2+/Mn2+ transporter